MHILTKSLEQSPDNRLADQEVLSLYETRNIVNHFNVVHFLSLYYHIIRPYSLKLLSSAIPSGFLTTCT